MQKGVHTRMIEYTSNILQIVEHHQHLSQQIPQDDRECMADLSYPIVTYIRRVSTLRADRANRAIQDRCRDPMRRDLPTLAIFHERLLENKMKRLKRIETVATDQRMLVVHDRAIRRADNSPNHRAPVLSCNRYSDLGI